MKYLTNSGLSYFFNKIKAYLTSSTYLNSIGISNTDIDDIADDAGYSSGSLPQSEDIFITGDIIPNTDNSVDLGASSKNIKMVYTKGITINGTQFLPSDYIPLSGTTAITGTGFFKSTSDSQLQIGSGTSTITGGCFVAYGSEYSNSELAGSFRLRARTTTNYDLIGYANGSLTWGTKNVAMAEDTIPRSGGAVITGTNIGRADNTGNLDICGGTSWNNGASIALVGKDASSDVGYVVIKAQDLISYNQISLYPSGNIEQCVNGTIKNLAMAEDVVPRSGGAVFSSSRFSRTVNNDELRFDGGSTWETGASILLSGKDRPDALAGSVILHASNKQMYLTPDGTWTWNGQSIQTTSDQRLKQQISEIDDKLLDAWEDVTLCQFKYNDAVDQKGDNARLHTGYVVQQIDEACQKHNIDISEYGLYCHEEYPEETEEVEVEQEDGTIKKETKVIREASEHYSLRYTETLVVECAYLRKKIKELEERLEKLELQ